MKAEKNFQCRSINKTKDHTRTMSIDERGMIRDFIMITDNTKGITMRDLSHMT